MEEHPKDSGTRNTLTLAPSAFTNLDKTDDGFLTIDDIDDEANEETKAWLTKHFEVDKQIDFNEFFIAVGPQPWLPWLSGSKKFGWGCPCGDGTFEMLKKLRPKWVNIIGQSANLETEIDNREGNHGEMKPKPSKGLIDISKISSHTSVTDKLWNFGVDYITATDGFEQEEKRKELDVLLSTATKGDRMAVALMFQSFKEAAEARKQRVLKSNELVVATNNLL